MFPGRNPAHLLVALSLFVSTSVCLPEVERKALIPSPNRRNSLQHAGAPLLAEWRHDVPLPPLGRGGGSAAASAPTNCFALFKPGATNREKWLAFWLLAWNSMALLDAFFFTFRPAQSLDCYLVGDWGRHALAQTRLLANCQLGLIACVALIALTGTEYQIKWAFKIMIACTLGAFRAVHAGVQEGTIKAPWKTGYAVAMALPPLLLLSYFAFVF